ncbi:MAG: hypothetical protein HKL80_09565, partial [Acidimicrobiales bacterium]|nr:hypothetical protein [Acidimicrobiales bacterium]
NGQVKVYTTVWFSLDQRSLQVESQLMPAPEEDVERCYEFLLRKNSKLVGLHLAVGMENAIYLVGSFPVVSLTGELLDEILGSAWTYSEEIFSTAMAIGFKSKYKYRGTKA